MSRDNRRVDGRAERVHIGQGRDLHQGGEQRHRSHHDHHRLDEGGEALPIDLDRHVEDLADRERSKLGGIHYRGRVPKPRLEIYWFGRGCTGVAPPARTNVGTTPRRRIGRFDGPRPGAPMGVQASCRARCNGG